MVDKYEVKNYIASKIGEQYVIPTLGVWDKFEDIDFDELPNQFVLKCTHDSGGLVVCKDKSQLDLKKAKEKSKSLWQTIIIFGRGNGHIKESSRELLLKIYGRSGIPRTPRL